MKLSEFKREMIEDLTKFTVEWLEWNVENPHGWPLDMELGDWYEHFAIYQANKEATK